MRCRSGSCTRKAWGGTRFCFFDLYRWAVEDFDRVEKRQLSRAVGQLFQQVGLSRVDRLILILGAFEQMSMREVSATLDIPPGSLLQMERRALQILPNSEVLRLMKAHYPLLKSVASKSVAAAIVATEAEMLRFVSRKPERVYQLAPRDFEKVVGEVMRSYGFTVQLTAQTRDGGYDLLALKSDLPGINSRYIVECKRYRQSRRIGVQLVRQLYGVKEQLREPNAILVATTEFTKDAKGFAESVMVGGVRTLHLVGFREFAAWLDSARHDVACQ